MSIPPCSESCGLRTRSNKSNLGLSLPQERDKHKKEYRVRMKTLISLMITSTSFWVVSDVHEILK